MFVACDESGSVNQRFFVLGSVWVPKETVSEFEKAVSLLRLQSKCWGEVKWKKIDDHVPENIMCFYEEFIRATFNKGLFLRYIAVDTEMLKEKRVTEKLQLKFMYLLISRNAVRGELRKKVIPSELHILFDQFQESEKSKEEGWRIQTKNFINQHLECEIEHLQPCRSHINSLVQFVDLCTGFVCEVKNSNGKDSLSKNKKRLSNLIENYGYGDTSSVWDWFPHSRR
ncbi:MAG: DUF3800 domain-containing protein [Candidatus Kaiserbacteria bacterium]|nr:DUF3800 domain-containing protein [Candidatus Kaiserbacteria bacterium]